jgi:hypothetical protein
MFKKRQQLVNQTERASQELDAADKGRDMLSDGDNRTLIRLVGSGVLANLEGNPEK